MAEGDRIPPVIGNDPNPVQEPLALGTSSLSLKRATEFLVESHRIYPTRSHYPKYRRYVLLNSQSIFDSLVLLYQSMFSSQWHHFHRFMSSYTIPTGQTAQRYAARVYISMWFRDLYYHNREAVRKISSLAFNERYSGEILSVSTEYDNYLTLLLSSIRPTHIVHASEDAMYIPYISEVVNVDSDNPFGLNNFHPEEDIFYGLLWIMKERKNWKISPVSDNVMGRPCWLFDWHTHNRVCAWFPMENNFNLDDVTLAYIIGEACTPKLGPRDIDDWQLFPNNVVPQNIQPYAYNRVEAQRFHGSYEVRTIDTQTDYVSHVETRRSKRLKDQARSKAKGKATASGAIQIIEGGEIGTTTEPSQTESDAEDFEATTPRFRIIDWVYYYLLTLNMEAHTRTGALRTLCFD